MMRFGYSTPLLECETLMSWMARVGRVEAGMEPQAFLGFVGIPAKALKAPTLGDFDALTERPGLPRAQIAPSVFAAVDRSFLSHDGEMVHRDITARGRTTFCPACLLEDARPDSHSRGRRVGRISWMLAQIRTCHVHRIALVRHPHAAPSRAHRSG
jgi:hypothetical protein